VPRLLLAALLAAFSLTSSASAAVPKEWLGVVADGPLTEPGAQMSGEFDLMAKSGVGLIRTAVYWRDIQPQADVPPDFSALDAVVENATSRGLRVLPVVQRAPDWAAATPGDLASPPRDPADYARFMTALVARYGPHGTFWSPGRVPVVPIRQWQIWNEPNITRYWSQQPYAPSYVKLLKAGASAIRFADPKAQVVLAGLPNYSWRALKELYDAGARGFFDIVALHPYTGRPKDVLRIVRRTRLELRKRRDQRIPVWVTELSFPASKGKVTGGVKGFDTTEAGMASRMTEAVDLLARMRKPYRIERVIWYAWLTVDEGSPNSFDYSGLRRARKDGIASAPALAAFQRLAKRLRR
jgi:hypothetical protein